ncbi:DUF2155 domain-containing protein [Shimia sp. MMG029]|uniref:DUF2155 domain-containing protein n=1 Tax=Shimia sp. MMG029 TaxID=3021978 RepID=UPI0022FE6DC7|nr:DUF2155 domain-containing protein [Shimia sp. MMG029]MDA5555226.1 DUF2155 domain-containing protein [Shimia sp. MMG029]
MQKAVKALGLSVSLGLGAATAFVSTPVMAQDIEIEMLEIAPLRYEPLEIPLGDVTSETVVAATVGESAMLRGLDKLTGQVADFELQNGYSVNFGTLRVDMAQCRHPSENPTGEAYAFVSVFEDKGAGENLFQGWMIASSPALSALDHPRYDVWVLRCKAAEASTSEAEGNE